jgi:putative ABC transport system ATP-binding protein
MDVLIINNLIKAYNISGLGRRLVIDIKEFAVGQGEAVGLKGGSGSGKTTLLHLISGLISPDEGAIRLDGVELTALSESKRDVLRANRLGCVYQNFNLLSGYTCLENVMLGMAFGVGRDRAVAERLLKRMGLANRLNDYPRQLSAGQKQRVAVARALANRPRLVLADEPTGNLDPVAAEGTVKLLREVCAEHEASLLLVTHDPVILGDMPRVVDLAAINKAGTPALGETT